MGSAQKREDRAEVIDRLLSETRGYIFDQLVEGELPSSERDLLHKYSLQEGDLRAMLADASDGTERSVRSLEHDRVRPLVIRIRQFALRHNLTLAEPFWRWESIQENANHVCFAGTEELRRILSPLLEQRDLAIASTPRGWDQARAHWTQLRESGLAIFDLTGGSPQLRASVCYRLGWALACGKPILVVARPGEQPPFDIDVEPASWDPNETNSSTSLSGALDEALFAFHPAAGGNSVRATLKYALSRFATDYAATRTLRGLEAETSQDATEVFDRLNAVLVQEGSGRFALLRPVWPGGYPSAEDPRCFHIMPFDSSFDTVRDAVRSACSSSGVRYVRADETGGREVIRSIWDEVGTASMIVADVTGLNVNVALEIGLADALGRPVLLARRGATGEGLFPEIAHRPVNLYPSEHALHELVRSALSDELAPSLPDSRDP